MTVRMHWWLTLVLNMDSSHSQTVPYRSWLKARSFSPTRCERIRYNSDVRGVVGPRGGGGWCYAIPIEKGYGAGCICVFRIIVF